MEIYKESMTRVLHKLQPWLNATIRCWRQEDVIDEKTEVKNVHDIMQALKEVKGNTQYDIANHLIQMDRMNAVEVVNDQNCGVVLYRDWP